MDASRLTKSRWPVASLLAFAAGSALAGQVTMFEGPNFQGDGAWTQAAVANVRVTQLSDGVSSVVVNDGTWEACTEPYFRGHCAKLVPGSYSALSRDLNGMAMSMREIDSYTVGMLVLTADPQPVAIRQVPLIASQAAIPVVISPAPVVVNSSPTPVVINAVPVQVVTTPQVVAAAPQVITTPQVVAAVPQVVATLPTGRMVLYQFPNFAGPSAVVDAGRAPDLDWAHFSYPASSLRVESGRWLACSHIAYQGDCKVFGPGDYPVLNGLMDQGVYSVRQIG